ncbi:hypothetical protein [Dysgonomonas sp. 521]|uniref:hypothetical protein n=1 Tax=Dysgonomonas sp. 521 TaxID=2302932 RepID=UPI0013D5277B|nr:hypothetical protein [Dysgonomonas sp. 521]
MIRKTTRPIVDKNTVIGTKTEYRLLGILLYRKELYTPACYGFKVYEFYPSI